MMQSLMAKTHQVCWPACALPSVALCGWFAWSRVHLLSSVGGCLVKSASAFFFLCCCALAGAKD